MTSRDAQFVRTWLTQSALPFWATSGFDGSAGLFHERLLPTGAPDLEAPKRVRVQARQIYVYAHAAELGLYDGADLALKVFEKVLQQARQPGGMGFVHKLDASGQILDDRLDLYDHAFLMLAFSWLYRVTAETKVQDEIVRLNDLLEGDLRHASGRGYKEDLYGTQPRRQNPHMHLLEASIAAFDATQEPAFLERAHHLVGLFEAHFYRADRGTLMEYFDESLNPLEGDDGKIVEPGHHLEWVWLLGEYERLAQRSMADEKAGLLRFVDRFGLDKQSGLAFDEVWSDGRVKLPTKRCWPQTEAIKAYCSLDFGHQRISEAVDRLFTYYIPGNPEGAWSDLRDEENNHVPGFIPASSFYHIFLALLEFIKYADDWCTD